MGVHIADVSHFIPEGSSLDKVAAERATSVYLVQKVQISFECPRFYEVFPLSILSLFLICEEHVKNMSFLNLFPDLVRSKIQVWHWEHACPLLLHMFLKEAKAFVSNLLF